MTTGKKRETENFKKIKRKFSSEFKSKVALEALSERNSIKEVAEKFDLNSTQVIEWKKMLISKAHLLFLPEQQIQDKIIEEQMNEEQKKIEGPVEL